MPLQTSDYTPLEPVRQSRIHLLILGVLICLFMALILGIVTIRFGIDLSLHSDYSPISTSTSNELSPPTVNCIYKDSTTCGCASVKPTFTSLHIVKRILNGYVATGNSWPWTVVMTIDKENRSCGGFLVTYQHFITAAHCVRNKSKNALVVYAGLQKLSFRWFAQKRLVAAYTFYPTYIATNLRDDIAVVKLTSNFDMDEKIGLCCLNWNLSLPAMNEHGVIVGWGTTIPNITISQLKETVLSQQLRQAVIRVEEPSMCEINDTDDRQFCAGYGTTDACLGDSGGPFMSNVNNLWTCAGIVSTGIGCGNGGIYTRVSYYRKFIEHALRTL